MHLKLHYDTPGGRGCKVIRAFFFFQGLKIIWGYLSLGGISYDGCFGAYDAMRFTRRQTLGVISLEVGNSIEEFFKTYYHEIETNMNEFIKGFDIRTKERRRKEFYKLC